MVAIQEANEALKQGMKDGQTLLVPFGPSSSSAPTAAPTTTASLAPASTPVKSNPAPASTTSTPVVIPEAKSTKVEPPVVVDQPATSSKPAATEAPSNSTAKTPAATTLVLKATHKIVRGESLFSIANKYQVTVAELKEWNSLSGSKVLVGQSLKIFALEPVEASKSAVVPLAEAPAPKVEKKEEAKKEEPKAVEKKEEQPKVEERKVEQPRAVKESTTSTTSSEWTSHTVKSGESLFLISKQYGTSIEDLIQWNALTSNNLKVGQSLKVGRAAAIPMASEVKSQPTAAPTQPTEKLVGSSEVVEAPREVIEAPKQEVTAPNTSGGFTNTKETGLAELIPGTEANKKYLVLHRTAPVGSVIRVKNEENNLTIFARVVGVLPETGDNSKVLIKLSQAAFEQLKGVNARFPVEILY
jgi:LysM repeat protein